VLVHLATWRATYLRRGVGWHLDQEMSTGLVLNTLEYALILCQPVLSMPTDCGNHYTNLACQARITKAKALASFGRLDSPTMMNNT
jgi:hypothetical protein